jgi:hypothetical protein
VGKAGHIFGVVCSSPVRGKLLRNMPAGFTHISRDMCFFVFFLPRKPILLLLNWPLPLVIILDMFVAAALGGSKRQTRGRNLFLYLFFFYTLVPSSCMCMMTRRDVAGSDGVEINATTGGRQAPRGAWNRIMNNSPRKGLALILVVFLLCVLSLWWVWVSVLVQPLVVWSICVGFAR